MNTERTSDLVRRAAIHAALADPARLQIADTLLAGDASPSELAALLAMPSNLLAHHLHVLEQAGVITRRRSEGDRRRTYLQLVPATLDSLAVPPDHVARRVLFVCTANSARSHLAAALWRRASTVPAISAGTHPAARIDPGAIAAAQRHRLPLPRVRPRHIDQVQTRGTWWSPSAIWPARNSAEPRRCTGPCRTRSRPAIRPASTRPYPSSAAASSVSRRAWP